MKLEFPEDFCKQVLECHTAIRFAGVADRLGKIVATDYRKGTVPLLSKEESVLAFILSVIRMRSRKTMERKLGKIVCAFTLYEKVVLATIPLRNNSYLMVSFDKDADHESIILKNVWPLLKRALPV